MRYSIRDVGLSIVGEGARAGQPMAFVRFLGCNLECPFCNDEGPPFLSLKGLTPKEVADEVERVLRGTAVCWVCLTGGEPTCFDLEPLVAALRARPFSLMLQTNGTRRLRRAERFDFVSVSPKWPPGLAGVRQSVGDEFVIPVWPGVEDDAIVHATQWGCYRHRWLLPVRNGTAWHGNTRRALRLAVETGVRLTGQLGKLLGV